MKKKWFADRLNELAQEKSEGSDANSGLSYYTAPATATNTNEGAAAPPWNASAKPSSTDKVIVDSPILERLSKKQKTAASSGDNANGNDDDNSSHNSAGGDGSGNGNGGAGGNVSGGIGSGAGGNGNRSGAGGNGNNNGAGGNVSGGIGSGAGGNANGSGVGGNGAGGNVSGTGAGNGGNGNNNSDNLSVYIGRDDNQAPIFVTTEELTKHALVCGESGSGKSAVVSALVEGVTSLGASAIILDVEGDYTKMLRSTMTLDSTGIRQFVPEATAATKADAWASDIAWSGLSVHHVQAFHSNVDILLFDYTESRSLSIVDEVVRPFLTSRDKNVSNDYASKMYAALGLSIDMDACVIFLKNVLLDLMASCENKVMEDEALLNLLHDCICKCWKNDKTKDRLLLTKTHYETLLRAYNRLCLQLNPIECGDDVSEGESRETSNSTSFSVEMHCKQVDGRTHVIIIQIPRESYEIIVLQLLSRIVEFFDTASIDTGGRLECMLVMDEAHRYYPTQKRCEGNRRLLLLRNKVKELIKVTRKKGLGLVLATQSVLDLDREFDGQFNVIVCGQSSSDGSNRVAHALYGPGVSKEMLKREKLDLQALRSREFRLRVKSRHLFGSSFKSRALLYFYDGAILRTDAEKLTVVRDGVRIGPCREEEAIRFAPPIWPSDPPAAPFVTTNDNDDSATASSSTTMSAKNLAFSAIFLAIRCACLRLDEDDGLIGGTLLLSKLVERAFACSCTGTSFFVVSYDDHVGSSFMSFQGKDTNLKQFASAKGRFFKFLENVMNVRCESIGGRTKMFKKASILAAKVEGFELPLFDSYSAIESEIFSGNVEAVARLFQIETAGATKRSPEPSADEESPNMCINASIDESGVIEACKRFDSVLLNTSCPSFELFGIAAAHRTRDLCRIVDTMHDFSFTESAPLGISRASALVRYLGHYRDAIRSSSGGSLSGFANFLNLLIYLLTCFAPYELSDLAHSNHPLVQLYRYAMTMLISTQVQIADMKLAIEKYVTRCIAHLPTNLSQQFGRDVEECLILYDDRGRLLDHCLLIVYGVISVMRSQKETGDDDRALFAKLLGAKETVAFWLKHIHYKLAAAASDKSDLQSFLSEVGLAEQTIRVVVGHVKTSLWHFRGDFGRIESIHLLLEFIAKARLIDLDYACSISIECITNAYMAWHTSDNSRDGGYGADDIFGSCAEPSKMSVLFQELVQKRNNAQRTRLNEEMKSIATHFQALPAKVADSSRSETQGLRNVGNSCFANAFVQIVVGFDSPFSEMLKQHYDAPCVRKESCLTWSIVDAFNHPTVLASVQRFVDMLRYLMTYSLRRIQEDVSEALMKFSEAVLCHEIGTWASTWRSSYLFSRIQLLKCSGCSYSNQISEADTVYVNCALDKTVSSRQCNVQELVQVCFNIFNVTRQCDRCGSTSTTCRYYLDSSNLPKYLLVNLGRFHFERHGTLEKISRSVHMSSPLDLSQFSYPEQQVRYSFRGAACHVGSIDEGHWFTAISKANSGVFTVFDDSKRLDDQMWANINGDTSAVLLVYSLDED